jgi:hypothetical protein
MPTPHPTPQTTETLSQQIFKAADPTTQKLIKALLNVERGVMHMKRRDDIHKDLGQIVKAHVAQP